MRKGRDGEQKKNKKEEEEEENNDGNSGPLSSLPVDPWTVTDCDDDARANSNLHNRSRSKKLWVR